MKPIRQGNVTTTTLIELVVATLIVIILIGGIYSTAYFYRQRIMSSYHIQEAANYCRAIMEDLFVRPYSSPVLRATAGMDVTGNIPDGNFKSRFSPRATKIITEIADDNDPAQIMGKKIVVSITWTDEAKQVHNYHLTTFYANFN